MLPLFRPDDNAMETAGGEKEAGNCTFLLEAMTVLADNATPTRVPQVLQFTEEEEDAIENLPPPQHNLNKAEASTQPYEQPCEELNPSEQNQGDANFEYFESTQTQPTQEMAPATEE
jgi:hypothetical protein